MHTNCTGYQKRRGGKGRGLARDPCCLCGPRHPASCPAADKGLRPNHLSKHRPRGDYCQYTSPSSAPQTTDSGSKSSLQMVLFCDRELRGGMVSSVEHESDHHSTAVRLFSAPTVLISRPMKYSSMSVREGRKKTKCQRMRGAAFVCHPVKEAGGARGRLFRQTFVGCLHRLDGRLACCCAAPVIENIDIH